MRFPELLTCALLLQAGCEKPRDKSPSAAPDQERTPATSANPSTGQEAPRSTAQDQTAALLKRLTQAARRYGVEQRRVPNDLAELVSQGYLSELPQPPPGKKFGINKNLEVYLTSR